MVLQQLCYLAQMFLVVAIMLFKGAFHITVYISRVFLEKVSDILFHQQLGFTSRNKLIQQNYANGHKYFIRESPSDDLENEYENILNCPYKTNAVNVFVIVKDFIELIMHEVLIVVAIISERFAWFTTNLMYHHSVSKGTACESINDNCTNINNAPEIVQEERFTDQLPPSDDPSIVKENGKCDVLIKAPTNHQLVKGFLSPELEQDHHIYGTSPTRELFQSHSRWKNLLHAPRLPEHYISKKWSKMVVALREHHLLKVKPEETVRNQRPEPTVLGQSPEVNGLLCMFPAVKHRFNKSND